MPAELAQLGPLQWLVIALLGSFLTAIFLFLHVVAFGLLDAATRDRK